MEEEYLEGDNKYYAEGFGFQNAKKGVRFVSFPPVLFLQLKRFEYDVFRDAMVKVTPYSITSFPTTLTNDQINDKFIFPTELDVNEYLTDDAAEKSNDTKYRLYAYVSSDHLDLLSIDLFVYKACLFTVVT